MNFSVIEVKTKVRHYHIDNTHSNNRENFSISIPGNKFSISDYYVVD